MLEHKKYIKKVVVEVETASMDQAMGIKQQSKTLFGTDFYKLLESILEEILQKYHPKHHYKFETICAEISISGLKNTSELKREMEMKIRAKIDEEIRQTSVENSSSNQALNAHKSYDGFLHYLIHGMYPWWEQFTDKIDEETMNSWLTDDTFIKKIKKLVSKINALDRLIYTTDNKILKKILYKFLVLPKSAAFKKNVCLRLQHQ